MEAVVRSVVAEAHASRSVEAEAVWSAAASGVGTAAAAAAGVAAMASLSCLCGRMTDVLGGEGSPRWADGQMVEDEGGDDGGGMVGEDCGDEDPSPAGDGGWSDKEERMGGAVPKK